ncbi:hypothetical protein PO909_014693 [Leuciscus waleckii]
MHLKTTKCNNLCLVATSVDHEIFSRPQVREQFEALFRAFDPDTSFQFFRSFRRVRINFTNALAAAEARVKLHKSDFNGKEMRLYFAQFFFQSVHIGSPRLEPPKPEKQFLISPPASPPVGWAQSQDAMPVLNYDLLCAVSKLGPGITQLPLLHAILVYCILLDFERCTIFIINICGICTTIQEINTFIQQGCIEVIKSDSKDIYNVAKDSVSN